MKLWGQKPEKRTEKRKLGDLGEKFAAKYLTSNGFKILEKNYLKKWGEIDIVAKKGSDIHFVEVKTVTRKYVIRETGDDYNPEDNIHPWKLKRLGRAIESYLLDRNISDEIDWQLDVICVYLDDKQKPTKIEYLEDVF